MFCNTLRALSHSRFHRCKVWRGAFNSGYDTVVHMNCVDGSSAAVFVLTVRNWQVPGSNVLMQE